MGMEKSNQLGKPNGNATTIFLRQGQTYIEVGDLTALSAKAETETDNGGGLFSMTFKEGAYEKFAEGQIYSLYIPFGEYKDGTFVEGSCEGYATLLIKIVPEYLTWTGKNIGEYALQGRCHPIFRVRCHLEFHTGSVVRQELLTA